ncbi:ABC transporter ATP-binding protein [Agrobacterium vitis]|uniref:ABC transporter ATP-binding protein n=1 Tax=Agrobacterium vitis TaxID=373 RepID=UPI000871FD10|nr:ABC transporter ATP-binding protein [Agrobacterium vitis]MCE6076653.1 ATP-binding cassette domain-containing protein [Agrobacterium vitis]MCM2452469.1 ABC transporter ATP-binding protein [Agrobacterium vitis]MCM2470872.1 ABC transporter ATP-binding protein [Agrobacterium vitis]MUO69981.1 ATP-binding cassette domain-containing protein [Agrobacterium vitis]MUO84939.1 ATP-binding cassette domain-containing protein [Agrobacterium vitis]
MTDGGGFALEVEDIHKSFGAHAVLKGLSLRAAKGDVISIIGSSGSGKSTFLRCINFLEMPDRGRIVVNGEEVAIKLGRRGEPKPASWRQVERLRTGLGMVFQNFNLWAHRTVLENVIEAPVHVMGVKRAEAIERAEALLHKVGLYDKRDAYPAFLSGGQQQRAAIARALCVEPAVMLFDEPTSALDPELVGEVLKVIRDLAEEGRTMLLVTHEMRFARDVSSHVMFLHQGQVEEQGPPEQVFGNPLSGRCREFTGGIGV